MAQTEQAPFIPRPSQQQIMQRLLNTAGPLRMGVTAAPGSGKTYILSYMAASLVERVADDQEVLVVTLVNAAVDNFRRRVNSFIQTRGLLPGFNYRVCTLHSLAHEIVRQRPALVGLSEEFTVEDERRTMLLLEEVVNGWLANNERLLVDYLAAEVNPDKVFKRYLPTLLLNIARTFIKQAKDRGLSPMQLADMLHPPHLGAPIAFLPLAQFGIDVYREYQNRLARTGVDFDDLIRLAAQALQFDPDYLSRLQQRWPYILEDEAQDSSLLQQRILDSLAGEQGTWVRVGDPNQAIYDTFTTANPEHLRQFVRDPAVISMEMPESGRSSVSVIALANRLITWTMNEHPHPEARSALAPPLIQPAPPHDPQPNPPDKPQSIHLSPKRYQPKKEIETVVRSVARWLEQNPQGTVAILDARNKRGGTVVDTLRQANVPYVELLKSTTATRSSAGVLGNVLRYLAHPEEARQLAKVFRVWLRDEWNTEEKQPVFRTLHAALRKLPHVEEFLWPAPGEGWQMGEFSAANRPDPTMAAADSAAEELNELDAYFEEPRLTPAAAEQLSYETLHTFREVVRRWQAATILPIDQLILTLAQDLFDQPADLALAHKFALVLHRWAVDHPDYRLPQFVEILAEVARNERAFLGFDEDVLDPEQLKGKVTIATMHRAKGLEWDRVYLMGLNNYSFPSDEPYDSYFSEKWFVRNSLNLEAEALAQLATLVTPEHDYNEGAATHAARLDLVRERLRLLYVGITRAKQELIITWNTGRQMKNKPPNQAALPFVALQSWWQER